MERYKELYKELYQNVYCQEKKTYKEKELSNFVAMRGCRYDDRIKKETVRFMVVGRAVNGWGKSMDTTDADTYSEQAVALFKRKSRFTDEQDWNMQDTDTNPYSKYIDNPLNTDMIDIWLKKKNGLYAVYINNKGGK